MGLSAHMLVKKDSDRKIEVLFLYNTLIINT